MSLAATRERLSGGWQREHCAEELAAIQKLSEDVDRHMQQWISRGPLNS